MTTINIAQLQFQIREGDVRKNIDTAMGLTEKALSKRKIDFLIMPEMWSMGFIKKTSIVENIKSTTYIINRLSKIAKHYRTHIISGSLPEIIDNKLYNTAFIIDPQGNIIGKYSKKKLFPGISEEKTYTPGEISGAIKTKIATIGISICFDLRFPSIFQDLSSQGAILVFVPAQFPNPRQDHWITLLKARAIENQIYIVSCNCVGTNNKLEYFGCSMVINPWGEVISNMQEHEGYQITPIDLSNVKKIRESFPLTLPH